MIAYFNSFLDILFPPACFACGANLEASEEAVLCGDCRESIPRNTAFTCPVCRGRLPTARYDTRCHKNADYILLAASTYSHEALRTFIWQLKFRRRASAAPELARLLYGILRVARIKTENFICLPIPLHASRLRFRGFNQTELMARALGSLAGIPAEAESLVKLRKTKPQAETKDREERRQNLSGCFSVLRPEAVAGKNILLIDDVWTSGTTMNEAARALKLAGAGRIIGLVAAKAG